MQSAIFTDLDYSGSHNQTVIFENDKIKLTNNIRLTEKFLLELGEPVYSNEKTALIWRGVDHKKIFERYLLKFEFSSNNVVFSNVEGLYDWVDQITQEEKLEAWNVVVAGIQQNNSNVEPWKIGNNSVTKVNRTRRKTTGIKLDIGVLRGPKDLLVDIEYGNLNEDQIKQLANMKDTNYYEKRRLAGLGETPQLLIYRINKDSKVLTAGGNRKNSNREDLNTVEDLIGVCITIPGSRKNSEYAKTITVNLDPSFADDDFETV